MEQNKRYYWLKLKKDFFDDKRMKRLKKISGGETYTVIYLKLLLLSLNNNGKLYFEHIDETFAKELALDIDENEDDIMLTLSYLTKVGLLEEVNKEEYFLTQLPQLIGSETKWAEQKRMYREVKKINEARTLSLESPTDVQQEIEEEKEIEIDKEKEKEGEGDRDDRPPPTILYGEFQNVKLSNEDLEKLKVKISNKNLNIMIEKLSRYIENTGKNYKSHYITILNWYEEDKEKLKKLTNNDMPCHEDNITGYFL